MDHRLSAVGAAFLLFAAAILARLVYWQVIRGDELARAAQNQYRSSLTLRAPRGQIKTADGFSLVTNKPVYTVAVDPTKIDNERKFVSALVPLLAADASPSAQELLRERWHEVLTARGVHWVPLTSGESPETVGKIRQLNIAGLDFRLESAREYPEASMAAGLIGIVASDKDGNPKGYFGLEGFYDRELVGRGGVIKEEKDALGRPILVGKFERRQPNQGKDLTLYLDRGAQFIAENALSRGLSTYGADEGSVTIMDPKTGGILAMASLPTYDPRKFQEEDQRLFHNPVVSQSFEPGSIFKPIVMAAALNEKAVTPETLCDRCAGPWQVGEYSVHTWDDKYRPNETMADVIQYSDNVGMTFVADKLGHKKLLEYLKKFGMGEETNIDLQDEDSPPLRKESDWYPIDYATVAFGQGIAVTPIQVVRAIAAIANGGVLVEPHVVWKIEDGRGEKVISPKVLGRVISSEAANLMTQMMVSAVERGEAKWTSLKGFRVAGKTGTAQVPIGGKYEKERTNASFVGFVPAEDPKFVMLVTLHNPKTSPWAAETAAPLWFSIANQLFVYWGIANFTN